MGGEHKRDGGLFRILVQRGGLSREGGLNKASTVEKVVERPPIRAYKEEMRRSAHFPISLLDEDILTRTKSRHEDETS